MPARWRALKRLAIQGHDHEREQMFFPMEFRSARFITDWPVPLRPWLAESWHGFFRFWFGVLYGLTSSYGRSVTLPVLWWLALVAVSAALYLGESQQAGGKAAAPLRERLVAAALQPVSDPVKLRASHSCPPIKGDKLQPLERALAARTDAVSEAVHLAWSNGSVLGGLGGPESARRTYGCLYGFVRDDAGNLSPVVPPAVSTWSLVHKTLSVILIFLLGLAIRNMLKVK